VTTSEQADSPGGFSTQRAAILAECERHGWHLAEVHEDVAGSAKDRKSQGAQAVLQVSKDGETGALLVATFGHPSRSILDLASILATAQQHGWGIIALDVDSATPGRGAKASVVAAFARFEPRLIRQRTRDALAQRKAAGVQLGRPSTLDPEVIRRIVTAREQGHTLRAIATSLNASGVATGQGAGAWRHSAVASVLRSAEAKRRTTG